MSRKAVIIMVAILLVLAAPGYWLAQHLEKREVEMPIGLHGEAKRYPLLAAERYLKRMGLSAERLIDTNHMLSAPAADDVLIITSDRQTLGQERTQGLLEWVKHGGRLIVTVPHFTEKVKPGAYAGPPVRDPLLKALGLALAHTDQDADSCTDTDADIEDDFDTNTDADVGAETETDNNTSTDEDTHASSEENKDTDSDTTTGDYAYTEVRFSDADKPLRVKFTPRIVLTGAMATDTVASHAGGIALISRELGKGSVVVAADLSVLLFRAIGDHDHALFLWHLSRGHGKVWLVTDNDMPPLWQWLWQQAPELVTASFIFLILWLWSRGPRFGPLVVEPAPARRRILEHIEASGRFLWQHQKQKRLLSAVRDELNTTAARRHPAWVSMSDAEKIHHIATLTALESKEVQLLLQDHAPHKRQDFTHLIRQLENIRKKL